MANITIYSTPTCPYCKMAKEFLKGKSIAYTDVDVSTDQDAAAKMVELSGQMGVPVIDIDGKIIVGFDKDEISSTLGI
jgi:glutaredoxin-like YruB-family protein